MTRTLIDPATREVVRRRAKNCCEYCGLRQEDSPLATLQIEHIIPKKHGGSDDPDNLALACIDCNLHKGSDLTGYDPESGELTELFHPRKQIWSDHFCWKGAKIVGLTPVGRTTVTVLQLNSIERVQLRLLLEAL